MKTEFSRFYVENGACIEQADMPLSNQGLVLIRGENLDEGDSNGSGKTTLFELLSDTIFGKTTKGPTKNALLNMKDPENYLTHLEFSRDEEVYYVDKFRKRKKRGTGIEIFKGLDNHLKRKHEVGAAHSKGAQHMVEELVGLSWGEFQGSVYLSQRYTHTMIEGKPSQKQEYLAQYFGLDSLDVLIKESSRQLAAIPLPDESNLRGMLDHVDAELERISDIESTRQNFTAAKGELAQLQKKLVTLQVRLQEQQKAEVLDEERRALSKKSRKLGVEFSEQEIATASKADRQSVTTIERKLEALKKRETLQAKLANLPDVDVEDVSGRLSKLESLLESLRSALPSAEARARAEREYSELEPDDLLSTELESILGDKTEKLRGLNEELSIVSNELGQLRKIKDVCYTCLRPLPAAERADMINQREARQGALSDRTSVLMSVVTDLTDRVNTARKRESLALQLEKLPEADPDALRARIDKIKIERQELVALNARVAQAQALTEQLHELPDVSETDAELHESVASLRDRLGVLDELRSWLLSNGSIVYDPHELQRVRQSISDYENHVATLNETLLTAQEEITKYETLSKQRQDIIAALSKVSDEKVRHKAIQYVTLTLKDLKKAGLRESTQLLTQVLPLYLKQLFPHGNVTLQVTDDAEGFDLLFSKGGQLIPLSAISGGQAKRVGMAIVFAFAKMGRRTTNLLICDEPFTHLDAAGRQAAYELLRDLDIGTILITAHDQDLNITRKYDQTWVVRMKNDKSRLYTE